MSLSILMKTHTLSRKLSKLLDLGVVEVSGFRDEVDVEDEREKDELMELYQKQYPDSERKLRKNYRYEQGRIDSLCIWCFRSCSFRGRP